MPPPETAFRRQHALVWPAVSFDSYGQYRVASEPTQLLVRFVGKPREMLDPQGNTIAVDATAVVAEDVPIGSIFWPGRLEDLPGTAQVPEDGLFQVIAAPVTPDLKVRAQRRTLGLMRYQDTMPETV